MYNILIRPFVRHMEPDRAASVALTYFKTLGRIPLGRQISRLLHGNKPAGMEREVFGINFYNPVGLGAGLDRQGELYDDLDALGFSFVVIGPLDADSTRIAIANIQRDAPDDVLGACLAADHATSFSLAYDFCDFFIIDEKDPVRLKGVIDELCEIRLAEDKYRPIIVKLPENADNEQLANLLDYCRMSYLDGVQTCSMAQTRTVYEMTEGRFPIIAECPIQTPQDARELLDSGASLISLYSGLITQGPSFIMKVIKYLEKEAKTGSNGAIQQ